MIYTYIIKVINKNMEEDNYFNVERTFKVLATSEEKAIKEVEKWVENKFNYHFAKELKVVVDNEDFRTEMEEI